MAERLAGGRGRRQGREETQSKLPAGEAVRGVRTASALSEAQTLRTLEHPGEKRRDLGQGLGSRHDRMLKTRQKPGFMEGKPLLRVWEITREAGGGRGRTAGEHRDAETYVPPKHVQSPNPNVTILGDRL